MSEDEKNIKRESWRNRNQKNSKKVKKGSKNTNKIIVMQKNQNNFLDFFLALYKNFGEECIDKNKFHLY